MKKAKILKSFAVFALLVTLGGCSETSDETIDNDTQDSESGNSGSTGVSPATAYDPGDLIYEAYRTGNYSLTLTITDYASESISYEDVENDDYDYWELLLTSTVNTYTYQINYTEDALLMEYYRNGSFSTGMLLVNTDTYMYEFDASRAGNFIYSTRYRGSVWQDYYYSLFDAYSVFGLNSSDFSLYDYGYMEDTYQYAELYNMDEAAYFFLSFCCGLDFWFGEYMYDHAYTYLYYAGTYFYPDSQTMDIDYYESIFYYTDTTYEYVYLVNDDFDSYVYDVGKTNIDSTVNSCLAQVL